MNDTGNLVLLIILLVFFICTPTFAFCCCINKTRSQYRSLNNSNYEHTDFA